jgi:hypothetical protein
MTNDSFLVAAVDIIGESLAEIRRCIADMPVDGLNWRPTPDDSNSLAAIAVHALTSTRSWLYVALGETLPERARLSEFEVVVADEQAFRDSLQSLSEDSLAVLGSSEAFEGRTGRRTHERPDPALPTEVPAAWALLHCLDHLREHVGQMLLTKQLWLVRSQSENRRPV